MSTKILIIADLGHSKVFRLDETSGNGQRRVKLLHEHSSPVTHHLSEEVTGQFGQFRRGSGPGAAHNQSDGQEHNLSLERRRRSLKDLASNISNWIREEQPESWFLAAPREINSTLREMLDKAVHEKLEKNVSLNLTRLNQSQVLSHFRADASIVANANSSARVQPSATGDGSPARRNNNPMRKPAVRRTSPLKKTMRKQKISPQLSRAMAQHKEKGDRRRTAAQREINESSSTAPRSARLLARTKS